MWRGTLQPLVSCASPPPPWPWCPAFQVSHLHSSGSFRLSERSPGLRRESHQRHDGTHYLSRRALPISFGWETRKGPGSRPRPPATPSIIPAVLRTNGETYLCVSHTCPACTACKCHERVLRPPSPPTACPRLWVPAAGLVCRSPPHPPSPDSPKVCMGLRSFWVGGWVVIGRPREI